jgi:hypothetical protein
MTGTPFEVTWLNPAGIRLTFRDAVKGGLMAKRTDYSFLTRKEALSFLRKMTSELEDMAEDRGFVALHITLEVASGEVKRIEDGDALAGLKRPTE